MNPALSLLVIDLALLTRGILDNNVETSDRQIALLDGIAELPAGLLTGAQTLELRKAILSGVPQRILTQIMTVLAPAPVATPVAPVEVVTEAPAAVEAVAESPATPAVEVVAEAPATPAAEVLP